MSQATTVKIVDPRIEPQPAPVYAVTEAPLQNQFYKVPASGISNSYITFNNLTTLGKDRAYLDTFELEIEAQITFTLRADAGAGETGPDHAMWCFDSFPFNKVCDEARVNINGGAFFSQPLSYVRAKERYWDEKKISDAYTGICPCHKPWMQNETGLPVVFEILNEAVGGYNERPYVRGIQEVTPCRSLCSSQYMTTASGINSTPNNWFINGNRYTPARGPSGRTTVDARWREPIFASPFSSRIDGTYGRPLYNITSIDIAFHMQDLRNMILCTDPRVASFTVDLVNVNLCYQVETVAMNLVPDVTVVPYRRFVPYVTDYNRELLNIETGGPDTGFSIKQGTTQRISITSGVYTLNEVPTAIWIFAGPTKAELQQCLSSDTSFWFDDAGTPGAHQAWNSFGYNRPFGCIRHVSISAANTTQILNTATEPDLYRIAKANGLQDNWMSWRECYDASARHPVALPPKQTSAGQTPDYPNINDRGICGGMGSVLRLIPGTDIVLQDQPLIPGSNANNMVFQVTADFEFPIVPYNFRNVSLWLLFEYVGVAAITPGQCEITMNPLGNAKDITLDAVLSANQMGHEAAATEAEGGSLGEWLKNMWGKIKQGAETVSNVLKDTKAISTIGNTLGSLGVPFAGTVANIAGKMGYGRKRPRITGASGGARMGLDDFCQ